MSLKGPFPDILRRVYRNDPIQEAVCEIRFRLPEEGWAVLPGQMFDRLRREYPAEPTQEGLPAILPPPQEASSSMPLGMQVVIGQGLPGRVRLSDPTGSRLLLISPRLLGINSLRPYDGWEQFSGRVRQAMAVLSEVVSAFDVERIGLRYINRLTVPSTQLDKYFDVRPLSFGDLPLVNNNFLCRSELSIRDQPNRLLIGTFGSGISDPSEVDASSDSRPFVLDLDALAQNLEGVSTVNAVMDVLTELRSIERAAFESAITETARTDIFGGYEVKAHE